MSYETTLAWIADLTEYAKLRPMTQDAHTQIGMQMHTATDDIKRLYPERWDDAVAALNAMWLAWIQADPDEASRVRWLERAEGGWFRVAI